MGASPAIKSSNVGPEERDSENFDFGGTGPEAVARKRACRGNLDGLRAMFIEGELQVTGVCSGLLSRTMNALSRREEDTLLKATKARALKECDPVVKGI